MDGRALIADIIVGIAAEEAALLSIKKSIGEIVGKHVELVGSNPLYQCVEVRRVVTCCTLEMIFNG